MIQTSNTRNVFASPGSLKLTRRGEGDVVNDDRGGDWKTPESEDPVTLFALLRRQRIVWGFGVAHVTIERFRIQWKNIDWLC